MSDGPRRDYRGFTLTELMVTVAIVGVLLGLLMPGLAAMRKNSQVMGSQSNMRQITVGLALFSVANKDEIISPNTEKQFDAGGEYGIVNCRAWVNAVVPETVELITSGGATYGVELPGALATGSASHYIGSGGFEGGVYRSPLDPTGRIRSYSLNGALGRVPDLGFMWLLEDLDIQTAPARTLANVRKVSDTLYVIPEDMRGQIGSIPDGGWNLHGWILDFFDSRWIDVPAYWARDGINLAFLDGHAEYHLWEDKELPKRVQDNHTIYPGDDFDYMISIMMPGLEHHIGADH